MEESLVKDSVQPIDRFLSTEWNDITTQVRSETVTSEFGEFETHWMNSGEIKERVYLPKYYNRELVEELKKLEETCTCVSIGELVQNMVLEWTTGDEVGKLAYGTGSIPFIRTSDFANWEIKYDPKQSVSEEIYMNYKKSQDVRLFDILMVRDGTYLVGNSCIITEQDIRMLYCAGIYKIRVLNDEVIGPWLFLGLLNSYIVKRQIRTKQFTRDVIDTLGNRLNEIVLPIPKTLTVRRGIERQVKSVALERINARKAIKELALQMLDT